MTTRGGQEKMMTRRKRKQEDDENKERRRRRRGRAKRQSSGTQDTALCSSHRHHGHPVATHYGASPCGAGLGPFVLGPTPPVPKQRSLGTLGPRLSPGRGLFGQVPPPAAALPRPGGGWAACWGLLPVLPRPPARAAHGQASSSSPSRSRGAQVGSSREERTLCRAPQGLAPPAGAWGAAP